METQTRSVSTILLDFVFGEPIPQPEVIEENTEKAWQEWLDATEESAASNGFAATRPMDMH